jgi:putative transposase
VPVVGLSRKPSGPDGGQPARGAVLAVLDDVSRECLALVADTSLSGRRAARDLGPSLAARGEPLMVVSDNGIELTSRAILR